MATARVANIEPYYTASAGSDNNGTAARVGLVVELDIDDDYRRIHPAVLLFADYAGLEAEYDAGSATTVLDSSIDTYLAAMSDPDPLPSAASGFIGTKITY